MDIKISLSLLDMMYAVIITTFVNIIIASAWYSLKLFGVPWATYTFGSVKSMETTRKIYSIRTVFLISIICSLLLQILLIYLVNYAYSPHTLNEVTSMALVLCTIHLLLELPHIGYENRSVQAIAIHFAYHFVAIFSSLCILKYYFRIPKEYIKF